MDTRELITYCTRQLPDNMRTHPWDATNHGRAILQTEEQLNAYIAAYGEMHFIKCRAALQNFPFETLTNFEIVDWGCGQGIASLTLHDMLKEHGKVYGLKRITLIEPSEMALRRAEAFIKRSVDQRVEVVAINKGIPSTEFSNDLSEVSATAPIVIHLFSNILDIRTLSLRWLARKIASFARQQQIVCVGPAIRGDSRISDFGAFFPEKTVFSRISQYPYAYTETNHPFGCETMCFTLASNNFNESYVEKAVSTSFIDDYSYAAESLRGMVDDSIINAYNAIRAKLNDSDSIFIKPHISTDVPDIVVIRPKIGVLIFNVCNNLSDLEAQYERTEVYQRNLFNVHLRDVFGKALVTPSYWSVIKQAIFFPKEKDGENISIPDKKYVIRIYSGDIYDENILGKLNLIWENWYFDDELCNNVIRLITRNGWHSYKDGNENIAPTKKQRELAQSKSVEQKIKGVAGSGKTQVLAWRAVNAQVRTGGRVLILTFNLTLVNYIKYRMEQVAADFYWGQFDITNYHQFFKSQANNHSIKPQIDDWDRVDFFERYKEQTIRYDTILFDEAQDYRYDWYVLIKKYFLKEGGEFVVFGDGRQNIYSRQQDDDHTPRVPIMGRWNQINENSNLTFRIENPEITRLSTLFQEAFFDYAEPLTQQSILPFEELHFYIKYWNVGNEVTAETLCQNIAWIINEFKQSHRDITILSQTCSVLRNIEDVYIKNGGEQPITTFETKEQYVKIQNSSKWPKTDIDSIRRVKKVHFTIDYDGIKMATIHSFKGWESPTVILILQPEGSIENDVYNVIEKENSPALIYTAITRAKRNLFILNLGNSKYHDFFTKNIQA